MPSFKANVEGIVGTGELLVSVDVNSCIPANLGCSIASVNVGLPLGIATGIYLEPQALTTFPPEDLEPFALGQRVRISWKAEGPLMTNLRIRSTT